MCGNGDRKGLASPAGLWRAFPARAQPLWVPARYRSAGQALRGNHERGRDCPPGPRASGLVASRE